MDKKCGIYKITNKINNKVYIGQSVDIGRRWSDEKSRSKNKDLQSVSALYNALDKYGIENFIFEVLEECNKEELNIRETYWINYYNSLSPNGYNILKTANQKQCSLNYCICCGKLIGKTSKYCIECGYKIQRVVQNRPNKETLLQEIYTLGGFVQVGCKYGVTDNTIRAWCKNYELPTHTFEIKNYYRTEILHIEPLIKKEKIIKPEIEQLDKNTNEVLNTFKTVGEARIFVKGSKSSHITEVCQGKRQTAYGFKWRYKDSSLDA